MEVNSKMEAAMMDAKSKGCLNNCGNEATGKSKYCSDRCKVAYNRNKSTVTSGAVTSTVTQVKQPDLTSLPEGVSKPTGQRTPLTEGMSSNDLKCAVSRHRGTDWIASAEYCEVIYRLLTLSVDELESQGQTVPSWKVSV